MKAISILSPGGPEVLQLVEASEPTPGPGEVTIDVAYAGVGLVDTIFRRGVFPLPMPLTPGIEVSGHVRAVGPDITDLAVGQPVAALLNDFFNLPGCGGYAEVALARAALTVPRSDQADLAQAAAVLVNGTTAWMALRDIARMRTDETVMVLGATGGLGGSIGQAARRLGVRRLIGVIGSVSNRELAQQVGYHEVLAVAELPGALQRLTGDGIDVVFDTVGGSTRRMAFEALAPLGRLVILGNASGADESFSGDQIWLGTKTVTGLSVGGVAHLIPERIAAAARDVLGWAHHGELAGAPALVLPLADAAEAHRLLESRKVAGKIVLSVKA